MTSLKLTNFNKKWIIALGLFLIWTAANFLHLYPHWLAWKTAPDNIFFTQQVSWFDPWDLNVYAAAIQWGQQGHLLLKNLASTTDQQPTLFYPIYTLAGLILPTTNVFLIFYGLATITRVFFVGLIYWGSKKFLNKTWSLINTAVVIFGGGLGWVVSNLIEAGDLRISGVTSYTTLQRPHEAIGVGLYLISVILIYKILINPHKKLFLLLAGVSSLLIIFYPYYLVVLLALLGFGIISHKIKLEKMVWMLAPIILTILYYFHLSGTGFASVSTQSLKKVGIIQLLFGHILLIPLAVWSYVKNKQQFKIKYLAFWYLAAIALSFLPMGFSRFYLRGLFFPLTILSLIQFKSLWRQQRPIALLLIFSFLIYLPVTQLSIFKNRIKAVNSDNPWIYQNQAYGRALEYIKENQVSNILSNYVSGNQILAHTGKQVYIGHLIQTPKATQKQKSAIQFYSNAWTENEALEFLQENNINYIFYSANEQAIGAPEYEFLAPVFVQEDVKIFSWR